MKYKHILVALDLSDESKLLIDRAVFLANLLDAEVSFSHIDVSHGDLSLGLLDLNLPQNQQLLDGGTMSAHKEFMQYAQCPIKHFIIGSGDLAEQLRDTIIEYKVDLVICGHHQDFWSKIISSSRQVIHRSPADILVVPIET